MGLKRYDPGKPPDPKDWLALDEAGRLEVVSSYHRRANVAPPVPRGHVMLHVMVENQLAAAEPVVAATLERLQREGLTRHAAIHAIGAVLLRFLNARVKETETSSEEDPNAAYFRSLEQLTAAGWLASSSGNA